jgi:hypothetical protein
MSAAALPSAKGGGCGFERQNWRSPHREEWVGKGRRAVSGAAAQREGHLVRLFLRVRAQRKPHVVCRVLLNSELDILPLSRNRWPLHSG